MSEELQNGEFSETAVEKSADEIVAEESAAQEPVDTELAVDPVDEPVDEPEVEEGVEAPKELTEEEKEGEKDAAAEARIRELAWKMFDEHVAKLDMAFKYVELLPTYLTAAIKITQGRAKKWGELNQAREEFYNTEIKDLELEENVEKTEEQN